MTKTVFITFAAVAAVALTPLMAQAKGPRGGERPAFEQLDTNSDGAVTLAEIQAHQQGKFAAIDTNGDGALSAEEMLASREKANSNRAERRVKRMISRMDANDNGLLEMGEMQKQFDGSRMLKHLDADGDGNITASEYEAGKGRQGGRRGGDKNANSDN